jgi:hypothetical protein
MKMSFCRDMRKYISQKILNSPIDLRPLAIRSRISSDSNIFIKI